MDGCGGRGGDQGRLTDDSREDLMYKYAIQTDAVCLDPVSGRQIRPLLHHNPSIPPNPYFSPRCSPRSSLAPCILASYTPLIFSSADVDELPDVILLAQTTTYIPTRA